MKASLCLLAFVATASVLLIAGPALAQDPVSVAPDIYKISLDNERLRILDVTLKAGATSPMHSHPDYIVYTLSAGKVRFTSPDGKTETIELTPGQSVYRNAESHSVENLGNTDVHVLNIELKEPTARLAAERAEPGMATHAMLAPTELKWQLSPPSLPIGAQMTILEGDPAKPGPFTVRFKAPDNYRIPPHTHPGDEHVTILSGILHFGMGDEFDMAKGKTLPAGGFSLMPAGMRHYVWTEGETIVQLHGVGPWGITYVNPADDPRNAK